MPPSSFGGVLLRRWRTVAIGIVVTLGLALSAFVVVPAGYEARALIVLLPPRNTVGTGGNPYLELGGLSTASAVLALAMNTTEVADTLARTNPSATFTIEQDPSTSGPVLAVTVEDRTPDAALSGLDAVVRQADPQMATLQTDAGAPTDNLITVAAFARDTTATVVRRVQLRVVLVATALGLLMTLACVALLERRRNGRRSGDPLPPPRPDAPLHATNGAGWVPPTAPVAPPSVPATAGPRTAPARRPPGPTGVPARRPRPGLGSRTQTDNGPGAPPRRDANPEQT